MLNRRLRRSCQLGRKCQTRSTNLGSAWNHVTAHNLPLRGHRGDSETLVMVQNNVVKTRSRIPGQISLANPVAVGQFEMPLAEISSFARLRPASTAGY